MRSNLEKSLELIFGHEGGYVNVKTDRGGPTKFGITYRTLGNWRKLGRPATADEVKALGITEAAQILKAQYADPIGFDHLPLGLDYCQLDYATNSGPGQANKALQRVLGMTEDGQIGPNTLGAVRRYVDSKGVDSLIKAVCDARMKFLQSLGGSQGFRANGRGWTIRVTGKDPKGQYKPQPGVLGNALAMASHGGAMKSQINTLAELPPGLEATAQAPASPSNVKVRSTTQGKGVIATTLGVATSQVNELKTTVEPYIGFGHWMENLFTILTWGGVGLAVVGLGVTVVGVVRGIKSGAPTAGNEAPSS